MEPSKSTTWHKLDYLKKQVEFLYLATIAEMRKMPFITFPDEAHPKAVEFAMIVRNEFTKRLTSELENMPPNANPAYIRARFHWILESLRDEIVEMADNGSGWLEHQLAHVSGDSSGHDGVYYWADKYLGAMLISIDV